MTSGLVSMACPEEPCCHVAFPARALQMRLDCSGPGLAVWASWLHPDLVDIALAKQTVPDVTSDLSVTRPKSAHQDRSPDRDDVLRSAAKLTRASVSVPVAVQAPAAGVAQPAARVPESTSPPRPVYPGAPSGGSSESATTSKAGARRTRGSKSWPEQESGRGTASDAPDTLDSASRVEPPKTHDVSVSSVLGQVWHMSKDVQGCRLVQLAFDNATNNEQRMALAEELHGHVWEGVRDLNANHVLQKCIATVSPGVSQFIVDELVFRDESAVTNTAKHRYGCRIIQRLLEHCPPHQVTVLTENLLERAEGLCTHAFANYVMQHILEHGTTEQQRHLTEILRRQVTAMASDAYGSAVLGKALHHVPPEEQQALAKAVLDHPGLLVSMACNRHGQAASKHLLQTLTGPLRDEARRQFFMGSEKLRASRYGRLVQKQMGPDIPDACVRGGGGIQCKT